MAKVKFIKTDQNKLTDGIKDEGQIILSSDTLRMFWDIDDQTRVEISDIIELTNEIERISLVNPLEKFYFVLSTKVLWRFQNNEWIPINTDEIDIWMPQVSTDGVLSWIKSSSNIVPKSISIKGNDGEKGKSVYPWNSSTPITNISQISGMVVGDAILNTSTSTVSILGQSTAIGDIVVSTSSTYGIKTGNIRGAMGSAGVHGEDSYSIFLTNESHVFPADTSAAIADSTTSTIIAFKGTTQISTTIGDITGQVTGLTTSISNNGTISASITITVNTSLTARNGVLTIPVTIDGKNFIKYFSWSLALTGSTGATGATGSIGATGITGAKGDAGLFYGTCTTGATTVEKIVTLSGFSLTTNTLVAIKFTNTNTANNPTLNINGLGAKSIYFNGSSIPPSMLFSGSVFLFVYNGNQFEFVGSLDSYSRSEINSQISNLAKKDNTLQTTLYAETSNDLGNPNDGVTKENIFVNPPLDKMASFSRHNVNYAVGEATTFKTPLSSSTTEWWEVLTFKGSNSRVVQIAIQIYNTTNKNMYFRTRHNDTSDFSIWEPWQQISTGTGSSFPQLSKIDTGGKTQRYNGDLNLINNTCFVYSDASDYVAMHKPINGNGFVLTNVLTGYENTNGYCIQQFQKTGTNDIYIRAQNGGVWTDWAKITIASELATKAPLASPVLTGTPTAPTAAVGTNNSQIATTSFVNVALNEKVSGKWTFYRSLSDLGLTAGQETIESIVTKMANFSIFISSTGSGFNASQYPGSLNGVLTIVKIASNRCYLEYVVASITINTRYIGNYYDAFSGWHKVLSSSDGNISASQITSGTLPIVRGGTGATTAAAALAELGGIGNVCRSDTASTGIATNSKVGQFEIANTSSDSTSAASISFHRQGKHAVNFGLDIDNKLKVGGWSMGNVAYEMFHRGNLSLPLSISNGGTGSTSASAALTALGAAASNHTHSNYANIEHGTWTPKLLGGTTESSATCITNGRYTKIGELLFISGNINLVSKTGIISGTQNIGGLPFVPYNNNMDYNSGMMIRSVTLPNDKYIYQITPWLNISQNYFSFGYFNESGVLMNITDTMLNNGSAIYFNLTYKI